MPSVLWAIDLGDAVFRAFMGALVVGWILLLGLMLVDMFRDPTLGAWAKIGWVALMVALPFAGIFAYLWVRGDAFGRRVGAARAAAADPPSDG